MDKRRLNQARGGSAEAEANAISMYNAIFLFVLFLLDGSFVHRAGLCSLELFSSPSPSVASALTAVPPKSVGQSGNHFARSTRLTTLAGTEVASDRRQRYENTEGNNPWRYSLSLSWSECYADLHAASLLTTGGLCSRRRGGGPPIEYGS